MVRLFFTRAHARLSAVATLLALVSSAALAHETPAGRQAALENAVSRARADLAQRTHGSPDKIRTVSAEAVQWRDTSMGCGSPTASYAQIEVDGFQVILEYEGRRYDYRARPDGEFVLCEQGLPSR
jgi:hypothetical protein